MESQPQNPEFRINPENFHPCIIVGFCANVISSKSHLLAYVLFFSK